MSFASMGAKVLKEIFTGTVEEEPTEVKKVIPLKVVEKANPSLVQRPTKWAN